MKVYPAIKRVLYALLLSAVLVNLGFFAAISHCCRSFVLIMNWIVKPAQYLAWQTPYKGESQFFLFFIIYQFIFNAIVFWAALSIAGKLRSRHFRERGRT